MTQRAADPYLHTLYDSLADSPTQRRYRALRPWPVGVVFIERPGMGEAEIRRHFRLMKQLGFTCLKQCQTAEGTDNAQVMQWAIEEGLVPWYYDDGAQEEPAPQLLRELGIDPATPIEQVRRHPAWLDRYRKACVRRVRQGIMPAGAVAAHMEKGKLPGTVKKSEHGLPPEFAEHFTHWLRERYRTVEALADAWNFHHTMVRGKPWRTWEQVQAEVIELVNAERGEYRRIMDVIRYKADLALAGLRDKAAAAKEADPLVPMRAGGEMSLFLPHAAWATDFEGIAQAIRDVGTLYPSIHPTWHFEEVEFEVLRPMYVQASYAADMFKGGWVASWESVGGPQVNSGGRAHLYPPAQGQIPGSTLDGGTMTQIMLTWIAAGFRGFGQWCWCARTFGWEAGESSLLDRNDLPGDRATAAGRIGQACQRLRDELWQTHKEPLVGLYQSFEADSMWGAMAVGGRDLFRWMPTRARIGACRALINANVPFEFVTDTNLRAGLADRYRVIYLPATLCLNREILDILAAYVQRGGRLVLDAPGGWYDQFGRLFRTPDGSVFERLFGCRLSEVHFGRDTDRPWPYRGRKLMGYQFRLDPTSARVIERFDDGRPLVTEHRVGQGTATLIATQAALACEKPGDAAGERFLAQHVLGAVEPLFRCPQCLVYRLASPGADHYFLLNDGPETSARLDTGAFRYASAEDVLDGQPVAMGEPIIIPAHSGRWLRLARAADRR